MSVRTAILVGLIFVVTASALLATHVSAADTVHWSSDGANRVSFVAPGH
jgi:hypothetical protein